MSELNLDDAHIVKRIAAEIPGSVEEVFLRWLYDGGYSNYVGGSAKHDAPEIQCMRKTWFAARAVQAQEFCSTIKLPAGIYAPGQIMDVVFTHAAPAQELSALPELPPVPDHPYGEGSTWLNCEMEVIRAYARAYGLLCRQQGGSDAACDPEWKAKNLRHYQHNDCGGLLFSYDKEGIERYIAVLESNTRDAARLDFVMDRQAFILTVPASQTGRPAMYQLMEQDEDEDFHVISGEGEAFRTKREAIDAAIAAIQAQAGDAKITPGGAG